MPATITSRVRREGIIEGLMVSSIDCFTTGQQEGN